MGFACVVEPRYMDTSNMDASISITTTTTSCYRHTANMFMDANTSIRSTTSTNKQFYAATIVPDAPDIGPASDDYDKAIGEKQHGAQPIHVAHYDGGYASHEQRLRSAGEWLMLLNAIKIY